MAIVVVKPVSSSSTATFVKATLPVLVTVSLYVIVSFSTYLSPFAGSLVVSFSILTPGTPVGSSTLASSVSVFSGSRGSAAVTVAVFSTVPASASSAVTT